MPSISTPFPSGTETRDHNQLNCKSRDSNELNCKREQADYYYSWVHSHIIRYQTSALGLFPRRRSSYVTDNVYCAVVIWALSKVILFIIQPLFKISIKVNLDLFEN